MTHHAEPLLFVHAHPDDETLTAGLTMAHYVQAGHPVHVLTCTLGEEGEVIPPELVHLDVAHDDALGPHRLEELRAAMDTLGVSHEVLGEDAPSGVLSRYRDSGMAGTPSASNPAAFVNADVEEAATLLADVVRRLRPAVVVTYDEQGGYGHPDHVQTHRVTCAAVLTLPEDERPPVYAVLTPASWAREDRTWLGDHPPVGTAWSLPDPDGQYPPSVVADDLVTHEVVDPSLVPVQAAALRQHVTQVTVADSGDTYALSNDIAARIPGREGFALLDPATGRLLRSEPSSGPTSEPTSGVPGGGVATTRHTGLLGAP
ncbi:N-acetyl-1-D-myo-inositol-2-amino-2-deoxy-alpha-D-glucopyranoside deacetylase [Pedococcus bigeumensis]|uniref:N-acetyl-1-D-myo-inositol-2-amino-2-deoxy-alpha-D-glucopyranoside deacetylase n=1 Tax=Pedococcus bigeumensis TaxID=433644 RepID=A0A502CTR5_9MICO|nr:N-acetyl-1-D-myo-inositol-2-amino-2-deoxy-alpha-D-glucopyranoside deacetylase [Pedococcus bigeumensis]TPG15910.1 N-acetyl-1-D-myo-inositol-2-amino-2-deoxy-alpha-D-glucopyranoside deacetylase [Pedococcus bigeumensis]